MYRDHFGLTMVPFGISPRLDFLFRSCAFEESMAHLVYGLESSEAIVMITGAIGTGKTMAVQSFLAHLGPRYLTALVTNTRVNAVELLKLVLEDLGVAVRDGADKSDLLIAFKQLLVDVASQGRRVVVVIDEAQNLGREVLEEIRLLTNLGQGDQQPVQVVLVGQPELEDVVDDPDLAQLRQRIRVHYKLAPLTREELVQYVDHRMTVAGSRAGCFSGAALDKVFAVSRGVPRVVNTLCGDALLAAFVAGRRKVDVTDIADNAMAVPAIGVARSAVAAPAEADVSNLRVTRPAPLGAEEREMAFRRDGRIEPPVRAKRAKERAGARSRGGGAARRSGGGAGVVGRGSGRGSVALALLIVVAGVVAALAWTGRLGVVSTWLRPQEAERVAAPNPADPISAAQPQVAATRVPPQSSGPADSTAGGLTAAIDSAGAAAAKSAVAGSDRAARDRDSETAPAPAPVPMSGTLAVGNWYIHVSSFRTEAQARSVAEDFGAKGHAGVVREQIVRDVVWFRVYLGPHDNHDVAVHEANAMRDAGVITYYKVLRLEPGSGS